MFYSQMSFYGSIKIGNIGSPCIFVRLWWEESFELIDYFKSKRQITQVLLLRSTTVALSSIIMPILSMHVCHGRIPTRPTRPCNHGKVINDVQCDEFIWMLLITRGLLNLKAIDNFGCNTCFVFVHLWLLWLLYSLNLSRNIS